MPLYHPAVVLYSASQKDVLRQDFIRTARAKGLSERGVLYGHVFRNAMLIVIAGFPSVFIGAFFGGSDGVDMRRDGWTWLLDAFEQELMSEAAS